MVAQRKAIRSTEVRAHIAGTGPQAGTALGAWLPSLVGPTLAQYLLNNQIYR